MALTVQNLRAVGTGVEPASLLPGQIAFNVTDKILYVGDGSSFKTNFDGTQVAGTPGEGWYAMPMDFASLGDYYVTNPLYYGDTPTDQQVLTWSTALNHPIWTSGGGGGGGNQVYVVTNTQVASASGATTSDKITAAIGVASPDEGDVTIVTGLPDDVYEGLYFFTTEWVKGAAYAYPSASEVIYDNTVTGLTPTVQGAIDDLDAGLTATTAIANTANSTANSALSIANAALPKAGGTMTGAIVAQNINVQSGYSVQFNGGVSGTLNAISSSVSASSATTPPSSAAVQSVYLLAQAALPYAGGAMTGTITFAAGQIFPVSGIQDASAAQKGVVQIGTNIQVASGVISILNSTTSNKGVVQLNDTLTSAAVDQALTARAGSDLQSQIDAITLASNVTLAGSINATTGLLDSVTTQGAGAGFVAGSALPAAAAGNADYYVLVTIAGSYNPPGGGGPYTAEPGDWFLSDGAAWQYLGVGARPQSATYTTAGIVQLADTAVTYTGTSDTEAVTPNSLQDKITDSVATTDSNLIASATAVKTAYDIGAAAIPCATITAVGDIVVGGAGPAPTALPVGTDGQVLVANSACATGLEWVSDTPGDVTSVTATSPVTADNTDPQNPVIGIDAASTTQAGAVQLNDTVTSTSTTEAATANAAKTAYDEAVIACGIAQAAVPCASFTAPGELLSGTGAGTYSALAVGSDGQVLLANSLCAEGLEWGNACYVPDACFTATGEIIVGTGVGSYVALPVGTDGQTLVADSTCTEGVKWGAALEGFTTANNTALGVGSLLALTTGVDNTAIGVNTGTGVTAGSRNVLIGDGSGDGLIAGNNNTAVGYNSFSGTGGQNNTVMGYQAGLTLTVGNSNTIIGSSAGDALTGANSVVAVGQGALSGGASATGTVAIGQASLGLLTSGASNTAVGYQSGDRVTTGSENTLFGFNAGGALTTGGQNILIGSQAGDLITTGSGNTVIGDVAGTAGLTNNLILAADTTVKFQANDNGAWSPDGTNYGTIGQVLTSNGTVAAPTWNTLPLACVPCAAFTAVGNILVGTGAATFTALPVGTDGQLIIANSACAEGVEWASNLIGYTCTTSPFNTALGAGAGDSITTGTNGVFIGHCAGTSVQTGTNVIAIGFCALDVTTAGTNAIAIGSGALGATTGGTNNIAIGASTMGSGSAGANNVAVGGGALQSVSGQQNVAVGHLAGSGATSGSNNTLIGYQAGNSISTGANNTIIGRVLGTAGLTNNLILAAGTTVKFQANANGAWSPDGTNFGTAGQVLKSAGTAAVPAWSSALYGAFSDSTIQTNTGGASGNPVDLDTTASANGFSIVSGSQITATTAGVYNIQISLQFEKTDAGTDSVEVWFKRNGTDIANSNTNIQLQGNGAKQLFALNLVEPLTAGQYLEVWWYSADVNVQLASVAAGTRPATPSAIVTVVPVGA